MRAMLFAMVVSVGLSCGGAPPPIRRAIVDGDVAQVEAELAKGISPNARIEYGYGKNTLLAIAVESKHAAVVKRLLAAGADPNLLSEGRMPFEIACWRRDLESMQALLEAGADPNYVNPYDKTCVTSFHRGHADKLREDEALRFLALLTGAKKRWDRKVPPSVLRMFVEGNRPGVLRAYHAAGVDLDARDGEDKNVFVYALTNDDPQWLRLFIELGIGLDTKVQGVDWASSPKVGAATWVREIMPAVRAAAPDQRLAVFEREVGPALARVEQRRKEQAVRDAEYNKRYRERQDAENRRRQMEEFDRENRERANQSTPAKKPDDLSNIAPICETPKIRACREATGKTCEACFYATLETSGNSNAPANCRSGFVSCGGVCCGDGYMCCVNQKSGGETCRLASRGCNTGWDAERRKW